MKITVCRTAGVSDVELHIGYAQKGRLHHGAKCSTAGDPRVWGLVIPRQLHRNMPLKETRHSSSVNTASYTKSGIFRATHLDFRHLVLVST
jgi:hypothetical protein